MKKYINRILLVVLVQLTGISAIGQPFLNLYEETRNGNSFHLTDSVPGIVDANSTLRIEINQANVQEAIFLMEGILSGDGRLGELRELNSILAAENEILKLLNQIAGADSNKLDAYKKLAALKIQVIRQIKDQPELYRELAQQGKAANEFVRSGKGPFIVFILQYLEEKAEKIRQSMYLELEAQSDSRVYFRLAAFLKNKSGGRPVHIENFDDYNDESFSELELFAAPLSAEDKQTIADHKQLTENLQAGLAGGLENARKMLTAGLDELFTSEEAFDSLRLGLRDAREALRQAPNDTIDQFMQNSLAELDNANLLYTSIQGVVQGLVGTFSASQRESAGVTNRIDQFENQVNAVLNGVDQNINQFSSGNPNLLAKSALLQQSISDMQGNLANVRSAVAKDVSGIRKLWQDLTAMLNPFRKSYLASEEIGEEVRRFTASNIPDVGYLDLRYIGERKPGDEILVKAVLEKGKNRKAGDYQEKMLYRRFFSVARVAAHVKMSGSLILANPYNREGNDGVSPDLNRFQFAPTYGIFMKWGSRKSNFYNDFVNFGLGMAFSSPDFNLDGTPEFGASLMLTAFRDVLGGGWGYNFGANSPYWFIGFNIPFNVGGLGGLGTNAGN